MSEKQLHLIGIEVNSASKVSRKIVDGQPMIYINDIAVIVEDLAMNGVLYPADVIAKAQVPDDGIPMPIDHPVNSKGQYISARNTEALTNFWAGAVGKNWRRNSDGRWMTDAEINENQLKAHRKGDKVLAWSNNTMSGLSPSAMHDSIAVWAETVPDSGKDKLGRPYTRRVTWMSVDHAAILPDSTGAATPAEGVGMWPNAENGAELQVNALHVSYDLQNSCQHDKNTPLVNQEESPMKDLMLKALAAAGVLTVNSSNTDEQVLSAYNAHMTTKAHADLTAQVNSLQAKVTAYEVKEAAAMLANAKTKADALIAAAAAAGKTLTLNSDALAEMAMKKPEVFAEIEALAKPTKKDPDPLVNQANLGGGSGDKYVNADYGNPNDL